MEGKFCLVTGATQGIGTQTARALAAQGASVLVHGRDRARAREVADEIIRDTGNRGVRAVQADFARLADVRRLAGELSSSLPRLDVLVNNAGLLSATAGQSADGFDLTFAVNHLAPFLLTNLLLGKLKDAAPARVVVVASAAHRRASLDFDDLMNSKVSGVWPAYSRSKLANILFTHALAKRLAGTGVTANALHPGVVRTQLFRGGPRWVSVLMAGPGRFFMISPERGARTSVYLATAPELATLSGGYYEDCKLVPPSPQAQSDADAERLWRESARLTGLAVP